MEERYEFINDIYELVFIIPIIGRRRNSDGNDKRGRATVDCNKTKALT